MFNKFYQVKLDSLNASVWLRKDTEEDWDKTVAEASAIKQKAQRLVDMLALTVELKELDKSDYNYVPCKVESTIISAEQLLQLMEQGEKLTILQTVNLDSNIQDVFSNTIEKHLEQALSRIGVSAGNVYNNKCDVHMPGNLLASYNEVQLLEDSCTDVLQESLTQGWRIISVCPQPDQRRPDYILGRYNPTKDGDYTSANRGK